MDYVWIGLGGIAGANARYAMTRWLTDRFGAGFPYGTLIVNITGAFVIGVLLTLFTERFVVDPRWRLFTVVGFLGSYTTFSSYTYEAFTLADRGDWPRAFAYVLGSNLIGLAACLAGIILARAIVTT